jgi:hypothetical protein
MPAYRKIIVTIQTLGRSFHEIPLHAVPQLRNPLKCHACLTESMQFHIMFGILRKFMRTIRSIDRLEVVGVHKLGHQHTS